MGELYKDLMEPHNVRCENGREDSYWEGRLASISNCEERSEVREPCGASIVGK